MTKIFSILALLLAAVFSPAAVGTSWADGSVCASDPEFRDIVVRDGNSEGWLRVRVVNHFDIQPSSSYNPDGPIDWQQFWNAGKSCDGHSDYHVHYTLVGGDYRATSKCIFDYVENTNNCISSN